MPSRGTTCATAILLAATLCAAITPVAADEVVTFDSARYVVGDLQQRLARERGETAQSRPPTPIQGYLSKPAGTGPFPAVVYLHGCSGLSARVRKSSAEQLTGWGYVTLVVDSFATRGIKQACDSPLPDRQADALGALLYLSKLPFVDTQRIALVGHSQGGIGVLEVASSRSFALFEMPAGLQYKAAVAFYPMCSAAEDALAIPTLVLIGELDDWSPIKLCEWWMQRRQGRGAPVKLIVYPEAFHAFDNPAIPGGMEFYFGHWLKYDPNAAAQSAVEMHDFLAAQLGN